MTKTGNNISLRGRWLIWRARLSVPALLSRFDEKKVVSVFTAVNGGLAILTICFFAWLTKLPLVFPALGPSAFILFSSPLSTAAAPRNVILSHFICLLSGYCIWYLISNLAGGPVSVEVGGWPLFLSASLSLGLGGLLLIRLSCMHPPACASSLFVALGIVTQWQSLLLMELAIVWLTFQSVAMNRRAGVPVPLWSPRDRESLPTN